MKTKPIQRTLSLISALAMLLTVFAVPAFAAGPSATASLDEADRLVKAGTTNVFDLTVTNTEPAPNLLGQGGGSNIDWVVITVSSAFADLGVDSIEQPDGWAMPSEPRTNQILFEATDGGLEPGESMVFKVNSSIVRPTADKLGQFQVQVSGDGGANQGAVSNAGSADLQSVLRILDISRIQIVEPLNGQTTVTDGQDNTVVEVDVNNAGSAAKTVVPTLTATEDGATFDILSQPAAQSVPSHGSATYRFPVSFERTGSDDIGTLTFDAIVDSADADAEIPDELRPTISVERAVSLSYLADTLSPRDVAAAKHDVNVGIEKSGVPAADLTLTSTYTKGNESISAPAAVSAAVDRDTDALNPVTFVDVPFDAAGLTDGEFTVNVAASGTDANGAPIAIPSIPVSDGIYLDLNAPVLTITGFNPPATRVEGMPPAATEGEAFHLTGKVEDRGEPCPDCTVSGFLKIGTQTEYPVSVELDENGAFDQDVVVKDAPKDTQDSSAVLTLTAIDATDVDSVDHRDSAVKTGRVDTLAPAIKNTAPLTGGLAEIIGGTEDTKRVDVLFPEGIDAGVETSAANWSVQVGEGSDNLVTDAAIKTAKAPTAGKVGGISYTAGQTLWYVQLTLSRELSGNAEGTVTYEPDSRTGVGVGEASGLTRIFDRVDLGLGFGVKELIDNIAPELPVVGEVAGKLQQTDDDGTSKFFTNNDGGTVTMTELEPGSYVELWIREQDGTEQKLATSPVVSTNSHTFENVVVSGLDRTFEFYGIAYDGGIKNSKGDGSLTVLDRVAPEVVSASFDGSDTLRLVTDEGLVGRDRSGDWYTTVTLANGDPDTIFVTSVDKASETESYDLRQRDLTLDTSTYDPSEGGDATLQELFYDYIGPDEEQFSDRAGNLFERMEPIAIDEAPLNSPSTTQAPQGDWVGNFGADGYALGAWNGGTDLVSLPAGVSLSLEQGNRFQWSAATDEVRALEAADESVRRAATWYHSNQIRMRLDFVEGYSGDLHLYALDWNSTTRRQTVQVFDGETKAVSLGKSFNDGAWVHVPVDVAPGESVIITITRDAGANAVLGGLFLGG